MAGGVDRLPEGLLNPNAMREYKQYQDMMYDADRAARLKGMVVVPHDPAAASLLQRLDSYPWSSKDVLVTHPKAMLVAKGASAEDEEEEGWWASMWHTVTGWSSSDEEAKVKEEVAPAKHPPYTSRYQPATQYFDPLLKKMLEDADVGEVLDLCMKQQRELNTKFGALFKEMLSSSIK